MININLLANTQQCLVLQYTQWRKPLEDEKQFKSYRSAKFVGALSAKRKLALTKKKYRKKYMQVR